MMIQWQFWQWKLQGRIITNEGEILEFLTYIMRREDEEIRMADSFKAAELLGKHYGMFGGKSESGGGDVIIVDNIEKAEQIKERKNAVQS